MNARVRTILDATPVGGSVLDIGAVQHDASKADRDDWLHGRLRDIADEVVGIDILEDDIADLRADGYDIRVGDAESFNLGREFDAIVAGELIEHLSNPGAMLNRCHEHLRAGGKLVLSTPNPWAFVHLRRVLVDKIRVNTEHTAWFGPWTLRQLLTRHGFNMVRIEAIPPEHGLTRFIGERLGHELLGSTHLVAVAWKPMYEPDESESWRRSA